MRWIILFLMPLCLMGCKDKEEVEYKKLVRIANRQEVEIAIIRQAVELQQLREMIKQASQTKQDPIEMPVAPDPKDKN